MTDRDVYSVPEWDPRERIQHGPCLRVADTPFRRAGDFELGAWERMARCKQNSAYRYAGQRLSFGFAGYRHLQ